MLSVKILLDRSASMQSRWSTSINSINEYVSVLKENGIQGTVTLVAFDTVAGYGSYGVNVSQPFTNMDVSPITPKGVTEVVRRSVPINQWVNLTGSEISPRGSTPLFDAVYEMKYFIQQDNTERGVFLIMTDGEENSSKNKKEVAEGVVSYIKARGWEVVFLGANFDVAKDARGVGIAASNYATFSDVNASLAMRGTAQKSALYATTGASISYNDADKKAFSS